MSPDLDSCTLVLLRRGERPPDLSEEESEGLHQSHLAYLREMRERGAMAAAGPFGDQPDERLRGLCLYTVELEEARRLAAQDPAVRAGRFAVEAMRWYFPRGEVTFGTAPPLRA